VYILSTFVSGIDINMNYVPGSSEILLVRATVRVLNILVPIFHIFNILCDHDVIDTYLSLRYICGNYCGPVYIKLNANHRAFLVQVEIWLYATFQSYQLIIM